MNLSKEQLKHDRINLGRLVKRLEDTISDQSWSVGKQRNEEETWVKAQGMAQNIRYARQLLLNVDYYQEIDPATSSPTPSQQRYLQSLRETLDRLDSIVDAVKEQLAPKPVAQTSYLSLVPSPTEEAKPTSEPQLIEPSPEAELIPSYTTQLERRQLPVDPATDPALDLLPSSSTHHTSDPDRAPSSSQPAQTHPLLSSSLQTHEELSSELSRMAAQLKRNAVHFSESLDKDKALVQSAAEALETNYDVMTKERVRLKDHRGKSWGTTWMVYGALLAVSIAWVFTFLVIRIT